jgi:hypothetical protein
MKMPRVRRTVRLASGKSLNLFFVHMRGFFVHADDLHRSRSRLMPMAKRPQPPKPTTWVIYKIAAKQIRLGMLEAVDESEAIQKAVAEFKQPATRLMAVRRS